MKTGKLTLGILVVVALVVIIVIFQKSKKNVEVVTPSLTPEGGETQPNNDLEIPGVISSNEESSTYYNFRYPSKGEDRKEEQGK